MKNKILPILCIFILISFLFINYSFATTFTITRDKLDILIDYAQSTEQYLSGDYQFIVAPSQADSYSYMIVLVPNDTDNLYYATTSRVTNDLYLECTTDNTTKIKFISYIYFFDDNCNYISDKSETIDYLFIRHNGNEYYDDIFYSTFNIYNDISCTGIFYGKNYFVTEDTPTLIVDGYDVSDIYNYFDKDEAFFIGSYKAWDEIFFYKSNYYDYHAFLRTRRAFDGTQYYDVQVIEYGDANFNANGGQYHFYTFDKETCTFKYVYDIPVEYNAAINNFDVVYANKGIYNEDHESFFWKAPATEQTLAQILEQNNPVQTFRNLMKNVLVSLIVFLVGFVAFLKAWDWLKKTLHHS